MKLLLIGLVLVSTALPLGAQENRDSLEAARRREQELREEALKRRELEELRRQAQQNREAAKRLKGQENRALTRLRRTDTDLAVTRNRLRRLQKSRQRLDRQLGATRLDLERSRRSLDHQRTKLAQRLRNLYKFGGNRELEFLLSTRSFGQLLARWDFLVMVAEQDRLMLEEVRSHKEQEEAAERRLENNLDEIDKNSRQTESEGEKLTRLRREHASSVQTIRTQRRAYEAAATELERTARDLQRLLAQLERKRREDAERATRQGRTPEPYTGDFDHGRGRLDWPVEGAILGRFGPERHPRFGTTTLNNGIDIASSVGTPVRAVAKGRVEFTSQDYGSFGQMIVLNHGDGYYTLYGHLSEILVAIGQEIGAGHTIARVGESGTPLKGTGLHFEVRKGGTALDPEGWLR